MTERNGHDPYAALRNPGYRYLLVGSVLASLGSEMQSVALGWELYQRTHSAAKLGLVGLVQFLPVFFLSIPAGHAVDRYSRKGVLLGALLVTALGSFSLAYLSIVEGPISLIYLSLLVLGTSRSFSAPARWSLIPALVGKEELANATTWNSSGWQVAATTGPALGGLIIALTGQARWAYFGAGVCVLLCFALVWQIRPQHTPRSTEPVTLRSLWAGVRFVERTKLILATITLDLFAVLFGGATALLPIYAEDILHVGSFGLGWLRAAPSIGAFGMALALAHGPPFRRAGVTLLAAVAGFGLATIVFGLSQDVILSFVALAVTGALDNISIVVRGTLVQVLTPEAMRGRVWAVNSIFISSSNQLGEFESGITAHWFGPIASVVGGGIGTILVVLAIILKWPQLLRLGSLQAIMPADPDMAAAETARDPL
jgi:MFS family permease